MEFLQRRVEAAAARLAGFYRTAPKSHIAAAAVIAWLGFFAAIGLGLWTSSRLQGALDICRHEHAAHDEHHQPREKHPGVLEGAGRPDAEGQHGFKASFIALGDFLQGFISRGQARSFIQPTDVPLSVSTGGLVPDDIAAGRYSDNGDQQPEPYSPRGPTRSAEDHPPREQRDKPLESARNIHAALSLLIPAQHSAKAGA